MTVELQRAPELAEALYQFLYGGERSPSELDAELSRLEASHGEGVYSELIFLLCHLSFDAPEAKRCWREIVAHRTSMQERLGTSVNLPVAVASYFLQVNRKLEQPKIIELKLFEATRASAYRDELTGLYNYRFFSEFLHCEVLRAEQVNAPLSLVMIDVDDFKRYNDHNGHEAGNAALRQAAALMMEALNKADIAARYGGEEFALVLASTPKPGAKLVAERIRAEIESHEFPGESAQPGGTLTVSMGVATLPGDARETGELVRAADRALYAAKGEGKNRVRLFGESMRSYQRVEADVRGAFQILGGESIPLTCVDLSKRGLSFLATREPEVGALIEVKLQLPRPHGSVRLTCRVVRITAIDSERYVVGSRILDMDANDGRRLASYISQVEAPSNPERREALSQGARHG